MMLRIFILMLVLVSFSIWAQDEPEAPDTEAAETPADEAEEDEFDDLDLDNNEDHKEDDADVFTPTDVVSYQQSTPYPPDI